jgi:hypothetical protein
MYKKSSICIKIKHMYKKSSTALISALGSNYAEISQSTSSATPFQFKLGVSPINSSTFLSLLPTEQGNRMRL